MVKPEGEVSFMTAAFRIKHAARGHDCSEGRDEQMFQHLLSPRSRTLTASIIAAAIFAWPAAGADNSAIPNFSPDSRTGWVAGAPDGVSPVGQDFLQPPSGPGPVTFDKAHPYVDSGIARTTGAQRTLRVADLSNPILQPWVREELRKVNERALTATVMFTPKERCWPIGVPGFLLYPVTPVYFLQTPDKVVMIWEEDHMARRIYLTDRHSPNVKPSWFGESIGHYENGDTLVVDTIGLNTRTFIDSYRTPHTQQLHVVERFRIVDSGKALEVNVRVEDPGAFTMPWNAMQRYRRVEQGPMREAVCAENNAKFFNYGVEPIPQSDTPDF
jgi:hypothetical protein